MLPGLIMDMPLMISSAIQYAATYHGETEVARRPERRAGDLDVARAAVPRQRLVLSLRGPHDRLEDGAARAQLRAGHALRAAGGRARHHHRRCAHDVAHAHRLDGARGPQAAAS